MSQYSNAEKIACLKRELKFRHHVYARRVDRGDMKPEHRDREIGIMRAILEDYERKPKDAPAAPGFLFAAPKLEFMGLPVVLDPTMPDNAICVVDDATGQIVAMIALDRDGNKISNKLPPPTFFETFTLKTSGRNK